MIIKHQLQSAIGNSIKAVLDGRVRLDQNLKGIFSKYDFFGEKAYIGDLPINYLEIGEHWTMEEVENNNLVFYFDGQERYRIRQ